MIWDIRPDIPWDKGKAVLWIREQLGLHSDSSVSFYLGDDTTDEDAFSVWATGTWAFWWRAVRGRLLPVIL